MKLRCPLCEWSYQPRGGEVYDLAIAAVLQHLLDCPGRLEDRLRVLAGQVDGRAL